MLRTKYSPSCKFLVVVHPAAKKIAEKNAQTLKNCIFDVVFKFVKLQINFNKNAQQK